MIRNLLYSLCLHLFFILIIYSNSILYKSTKKFLNLSMDFIDVNENFIDKIKDNVNEKNKNILSLQEKIDLYKMLENSKKTKVSYGKLEDIKDQIKNKELKNAVAKNRKANINSKEILPPIANMITQNSTKVYVNENKLKKEQIAKIDKNNKIQKKIKEKKLKELKADNKKEEINDLDAFINNLDKPFTTQENLNQDNLQAEVVKEQDYVVSEIDELMGILDIPNLDEITNKLNESEILNLTVDSLFNAEDLKALEGVNKSKNNFFNLTPREKINIQKQIKICYKNAILETKKNSPLIMSVEISLNKMGKIDMKNIVFNLETNKNNTNINKNDYNITKNNIMRALSYCNPLRNLPVTKYSTWKNMNLIFNNN